MLNRPGVYGGSVSPPACAATLHLGCAAGNCSCAIDLMYFIFWWLSKIKINSLLKIFIVLLCSLQDSEVSMPCRRTLALYKHVLHWRTGVCVKLLKFSSVLLLQEYDNFVSICWYLSALIHLCMLSWCNPLVQLELYQRW